MVESHLRKWEKVRRTEMKKISPQTRRSMLSDLEQGMTDKELKTKYGIADNRTLRKHLDLAEKDREEREVRIRILVDNQAEHLAELRQMIEGWKAGIRIQPVTVQPWVMAQFFQSLESNRLFGSLRSHLPFPVFWRQYSEWETKYKLYIAACQKMRDKIQRRASAETNLSFQDDTGKTSHLSPKLVEWVLGHVQRKLEMRAKESVEFHWHHSQIEMEKNSVKARTLVALGHGELLMTVGELEPDTQVYENKCKNILAFALKSKTTASLATLFNDLRDLESKIHDSLEEIRLRRDYILYSCKLCPAKAKPLRG
jgi:hypothetical protein